MNCPKSGLILLLTAAFILSGCSQNDSSDRHIEGLDKLGKLTVISREEGSGTRDSFSQLINVNADDTAGDTFVCGSSDEVIEEVMRVTPSIGYVSYGAAAENDGVRIINIEGVSPDNKARYPLTRKFYIAYQGAPSEIERDYLTYLLGAGQEFISDGYSPVGKPVSFLSNRESGNIRINGSTSASPLIAKISQEYMKRNPNANVSISESDSTEGLNAVMSGQAEFGISSRELKSYEEELLNYEAFAEDRIVVIVNKDNPIENLTLDELEKIYTGKVISWSDLYSEE